MNDYADDPFKAMTRKYDAAVMEKGGASIFSLRRPVMVVPNAAPKHVKRAPAPPHGFPKRNRKQLPGRIVGGLTGALGGWASDIDDREFGA